MPLLLSLLTLPPCRKVPPRKVRLGSTVIGAPLVLPRLPIRPERSALVLTSEQGDNGQSPIYRDYKGAVERGGGGGGAWRGEWSKQVERRTRDLVLVVVHVAQQALAVGRQ